MNLFFRMLAVFALVGGFAVGLAGSVYAADVKSLSGYKAYSTLSSFKVFLEENPDVYEKLKNDPALAEEVLGNTSRQREMMQGAVTQAPESVDVQAEKPADTLTRDEQATQAANEAIIKALAEKEAANKRAQETLELITQQEALINQARAEAELAAHEAKMENIRAAFDGHPEKAAEFFANTALLQKVIDDQLTLAEALAEAGITLEETSEPDTPEPEASDGPELTETPGPEYIEYPEDQLVHVYGNKYRLGDKELYDLNHVPSEEEMALDANGWPKFLNVPAECGPADPDVTYFFENRYGYGKGGADGSSLKKGAAMDSVYSTGLLNKPGAFDIGLTDNETLAAPFFVPNIPTQPTHYYEYRTVILPDRHTGVGGGDFAYSISYCPDDWSGITPPGELPLAEGCNHTKREFVVKGSTVWAKIKEAVAPSVISESRRKANTCVLEPGKRYFFNAAPGHRVNPERRTMMDQLFNKFKRLAQHDPEDYPLSPEAHMQNYLNNPYAPVRNGKKVGSEGAWNYMSNTLTNYMPEPLKLPQRKPVPLQMHNQYNYYQLVDAHDSRVLELPHDGCKENTSRIMSDKTCYDPHGKLPPQRVALQCAGPDRAAWVKGYDAKLFAHFICLNNRSEEKIKSRVCLSRNEGTFRLKEYKNSQRRNVQSVETIEQCQFNKKRDRYEWITIESRLSDRHLGDNPIVTSPLPEVQKRDYCLIKEKRVNLGESIDLSCRNLNLTCERVADAPALPALVNEHGFGLNRIPTDPDSSTKVQPLLHWLPNCTVE